MYLLITHGDKILNKAIYNWFHTGRHNRDMRRHLVEQLGPRAFLVKEEPEVKAVLRWYQANYDTHQITVYRVNEPVVMRDEP
jgi:hypothetical protein